MHIDPEQRQGFVERQRVEQHHNIVRHLRSLPQETRQPYDWTEFRRRAREQAEIDYRHGVNNRRYAALAAAIVLVAVAIAAWVRLTPPGTPRLAEIPVFPEFVTPPVATESADMHADAAERWLASLPSEPPVVRVGTRAAVAGLEDRLAQLDDLLSAARVEGTQPAKLAALEQQRARLVNSLVQVRFAETLVAESR
jgi:hypothetical protein